MSERLEGKPIMKSSSKTLPLVLLATVAFAFAARPASADTIYTLNIGNSAISGYPAPYGQASVSLDVTGTVATVTFTAENGYLLGGQGAVAVNVNGAVTIGSLTNSCIPSATCGPISDGGSNTEDGFGVFNHTFDSFDGFQHASTEITFVLTLLSGTWANDASVLAATAGGYYAAAHIFVLNSTGTAALATGYAVDGLEELDVPDGGMTMSLLGMAMAGLGLVARRKK